MSISNPPAAPRAYALTRARAVAGSRWLMIRYGVVGLLSLAGSTYLIRNVGPEAWAAYSVGYFLAVFAEQAFGASLLGALVCADDAPGPSELEASSAVAQIAALTLAL